LTNKKISQKNKKGLNEKTIKIIMYADKRKSISCILTLSPPQATFIDSPVDCHRRLLSTVMAVYLFDYLFKDWIKKHTKTKFFNKNKKKINILL